MARKFGWLRGIAAAAACFGIFSFHALAAGSVVTQGTVHVSTSLRVRSAGNTGAPVVGSLYSGAGVTILSSYNGWYQVQSSAGTGWVSGAYIRSLSTAGIANGKAGAAVNAADKMVGARYLYGGASAAGFDCSGLTQYAYAQAGVTLPHSSAAQAGKGVWVARAALQPGDLIFFSTNGSGSVNHVGIYIGNSLFIAANSDGVAVCDLRGSYWSGVYLTARRVTG